MVVLKLNKTNTTHVLHMSSYFREGQSKLSRWHPRSSRQLPWFFSLTSRSFSLTSEAFSPITRCFSASAQSFSQTSGFFSLVINSFSLSVLYLSFTSSPFSLQSGCFSLVSSPIFPAIKSTSYLHNKK